MIRISLLALTLTASGCCGMGSVLAGDTYNDEYDELTCRGWRNAQDPNGFADVHPELHDAMRYGMLPSEARAKLGEPAVIDTMQQRTVWGYAVESGDSLIVHFEDDAVVEWQWLDSDE